MCFAKPFCNLISILIPAALFLTSCNKDAGVIEKFPAVTKIDRSINTSYDIVEFSIVSEDIIFAAGKDEDSFKLFKTLNGGLTWTEMTNPTSGSTDQNVQSIEFFDELNGVFVYNNKAYRTYDGGASWTTIEVTYNSDFCNEFIFAGKTEDNKLLLAEWSQGYLHDNHIYTSDPSSTVYSYKGAVIGGPYFFDYAHYHDGKLLYFSHSNFNSWEYKVYQYDMNTANIDVLQDYQEIVNDGLCVNGKTIFARQHGKIEVYESENYEANVESYKYHIYDYHSIDLIDNYFVAVANKSISSNKMGVWQEFYNTDRTSHTEHFYKVKKFDNASFYISGADGVFYKASIQ